MSEASGIPAFHEVRQVHTPDGLDAGHIRYEGVSVENVGPGAYGVMSITWPYPVGVSSAALFKILNLDGNGDIAGESTDYGDHIWSYADVESPGIVLTQALAVDDTSLFLPPAAIALLTLSQGDYLSDGDDLNNDNHFHITAIDRDTGEVTFEEASPVAHAQGTALHMHRFFVGRPGKPYPVIPGVIRHWGEDTFDSALISPGVPLKIVYKNNDDTVNRTIIGDISILYGDA